MIDNQTIYVDIDGTICNTTDANYKDSTPRYNQIDKINKLYDKGNTIVYWTARGTVTGIDWTNLTREQLKNWGCKYNTLSVGSKPNYDLLICDRTKRIEEI